MRSDFGPVLFLSIFTLNCEMSPPAVDQASSVESESVAGRTSFIPAPIGCSMAHCDPQISDQANLPTPAGDATILWRDSNAAGSNYALGCVSNGTTAACSFGLVPGPGPYLKTYDGEGQELWAYDELDRSTATSAPMIDEQGRVIAADANRVVLLDADGQLVWQVPLPEDSGSPISPVITDNGQIVLATSAGRVFSIDSRIGRRIRGELRLEATIDGKPGAFITRNTPAVSGNRIYVSTQFEPDRGRDNTRHGRLYAIDVRTSGLNGALLEPAWFLDFGARSGASPVIKDGIIFFDGDNPEPNAPDDEVNPHFFGVRDMGDHGVYVFQQPIPNSAVASAAADPRAGTGVWFFSLGDTSLTLLSTEPDPRATNPNGTPQGQILEVIDIDDLMPSRGGTISSAITLGESETGAPVAMFTARNSGFTYHMSVDVEERNVRSLVQIGSTLGAWSAAQSPIVIDARGEPVVVLSTFSDGVVGIGVP